MQRAAPIASNRLGLRCDWLFGFNRFRICLFGRSLCICWNYPRPLLAFEFVLIEPSLTRIYLLAVLTFELFRFSFASKLQCASFRDEEDSAFGAFDALNEILIHQILKRFGYVACLNAG